MKTSLAEDDAQICAVPNVAWALVKAGHQVTILVDASALTSVTKGFGWYERLVHSDTTALDRARLPERERVSLSEQMGVSLEEVPHQYGEYLGFLNRLKSFTSLREATNHRLSIAASRDANCETLVGKNFLERSSTRCVDDIRIREGSYFTTDSRRSSKNVTASAFVHNPM